jgi:hypothetical protein
MVRYGDGNHGAGSAPERGKTVDFEDKLAKRKLEQLLIQCEIVKAFLNRALASKANPARALIATQAAVRTLSDVAASTRAAAKLAGHTRTWGEMPGVARDMLATVRQLVVVCEDIENDLAQAADDATKARRTHQSHD